MLTSLIPQIRLLDEKTLIGKRLVMSLGKDRTVELWKSFLSQKKDILYIADTNLFSIQLYDPYYFQQFDPMREFEKWAAIEVKVVDSIPAGMEALNVSGGYYAVFPFKGTGEDAPEAFDYIFNQWFPSSVYDIDNRPHFEILGEKYKNGDPNSEEEIWIPVRKKDNGKRV